METVQVIPAVLEKDWETMKQKVEQLKAYSDVVSIDLMDGIFVPNTTLLDPFKIGTLDAKLELHMMLDRPEFHINKWAQPNVVRMVAHYEAAQNIGHVIDLIEKAGKEVGVALNPETPSYVLEDHIDRIDYVLVMGVHPGHAGQDFIRDVLEKIRELHKMREDLVVAVDGGVNQYTRKGIVGAGANVLCANSFLWEAPDMAEAFKVLQEGGYLSKPE